MRHCWSYPHHKRMFQKTSHLAPLWGLLNGTSSCVAPELAHPLKKVEKKKIRTEEDLSTVYGWAGQSEPSLHLNGKAGRKLCKSFVLFCFPHFLTFCYYVTCNSYINIEQDAGSSKGGQKRKKNPSPIERWGINFDVGWARRLFSDGHWILLEEVCPKKKNVLGGPFRYEYARSRNP